MTLAKAFKSQDAELWKQVPRQAVRDLLAGLLVWSRAEAGHNPPAPLPRSLSSRVYFYSWQELRLGDVLLWALTGAFTEEERKALATGQ